MEQLSDEMLMAEVMAGKTLSLATLVERYHAPLLDYLYRLVDGDRPLAEDLVQETFSVFYDNEGTRFIALSSLGCMLLRPIWPATTSNLLPRGMW